MARQIRLYRLVLTSLLGLGVAAVFSIETVSARTVDHDHLDAYIEDAIQDWKVPGLAMAIIQEDQVVFQKGFGTRRIKTKHPVDEQTLFAIASNTKAFTATALGLLVQEDRLTWDDPVLKVLPDFQLHDPVATRKIVVRDLLCHRSGLGLWTGDLTWWDSNYDRAEVMRRIRFQKPVSDFRTAYHYTNLMFLVAGEIIPEVTGVSWDQFIRQRFFEPLNMKRSTTSVEDLSSLENVATPHTLLNGKLTAIEYLNVDNCAPAAAINSTVEDLSHWVRLQLNSGVYNGKRLVAPHIIQEIRTPHTLRHLSDKFKRLNPSVHFSTYGLGFGLNDYQGRLVVSHTGGLDGMVSYVGFIPEEDIGVIVLTNAVDHELHRALPLYVYDSLMGIDRTDWSRVYLDDFKQTRKSQEKRKAQRLASRSKDTTPTLRADQYAGTFVSDIYGSASIVAERGQLKMRLSAHPRFEATLTHWQYDTFMAKWDHALWGESAVYFRFDGHGRLTEFLMSVRPDWIDSLEYSFVKVH